MTSDRRTDDQETLAAAWLYFAAMLMTLLGITHLITGIAAVSDRFTALGSLHDDYLLGLSVSTWGWIHIVVGLVILVIAAFGLFSGASWARPTAVVVLVLSAVGAIAWLPYLPFWSVPVLLLDGATIWILLKERPERQRT